MEDQEKITNRKKPKFFRRDWHKKIKLGSTVKKNRKWRGAKGRQNKIRLNRKGYSTRPKVGWGNNSSLRGLIKDLKPVRVENLKDLDKIGKDQGIIVGRIGKKKRELIISEAKKMKIAILNRYREDS